jgi:hypothetical protein
VLCKAPEAAGHARRSRGRIRGRRVKRIALVGLVAVGAVVAIVLVLLRAPGSAPTSPGSGAAPAAPSGVQADRLAKSLAAGSPARVADALVNVRPGDLPGSLLSELASMRDVRIDPTSIRSERAGLATATMTASLSGRRIRAPLLLAWSKGRWRIVGDLS